MSIWRGIEDETSARLTNRYRTAGGLRCKQPHPAAAGQHKISRPAAYKGLKQLLL